jgi:ADP-heptose:LPS heptosyltransferase
MHNDKPAHVLVIRFSAMGDVILTKPVLRQFIEKYPQVKISLLSQEIFRPLFLDMPGLTFIGADVKNKHKGIAGLYRLARKLKAHNFNAIIDLHYVLRSSIVAFFINIPLMKLRIFRIDKGRSEKQGLTKRFNKVRRPLKHTVERYAEAFTKAGFHITATAPTTSKNAAKKIQKGAKKFKIGIAPLSRHSLKEWPLEYMIKLKKSLVEDFQAEIYILGGSSEAGRLTSFATGAAVMMAGKLGFADEIEFIKTLDLVVTMDSANMHLAGMLGIPCVSIWGPTHPYAGFSPFGGTNLVVQNSRLDCRPCSIFGNKPCYRKDHACMKELSPEQAYKEIKPFISEFVGK